MKMENWVRMKKCRRRLRTKSAVILANDVVAKEYDATLFDDEFWSKK